MAADFAPQQNVGMADTVRPIPKPKRLTHFIKQWRKKKGLTQEQLAERIGVTPGAISQVELYRVNYTQFMLEAISAELGCRPGDLLNVDPTREEPIWSIWETLDVPERNQIVEIARTFRKTGTSN